MRVMQQTPAPFTITPGFDESERPRAAQLYWEAFGGKLRRVMAPDAAALQFLERIMDPEYALVARSDTGEILGLAGFKTAKGSLVGGGLRDLAGVYGWFGAIWRGLILLILDRELAYGTLLMDGICVHSAARGQGLGTALLRAIKAHAREQGLSSVRLDVIDSNPRARALYEREGFAVRKTRNIGPLRHLFGFRTSTEMRYGVDQNCRDAAN